MALSLYDLRYDWPLYLGGALIVLVVGLFTYLVFDILSGDTRIERATVVQTFYEAPRTGTGVGMTSGGNTAVVVTSSGPEYHLMLEFTTDGRRELVKTNEISLTTSDIGTEYKFYCRYGGLSGDLYRCSR